MNKQPIDSITDPNTLLAIIEDLVPFSVFCRLIDSLHDPQLIRSVFVSRFIELLHSAEERNVRARATELLYRRDAFPEEADIIVPALLDGLRREWYVRPYAANTLVRIQPPPEHVVPALQRVLHEQRQMHPESDSAVDYLGSIERALGQMTAQGRKTHETPS